MILGNFQAVLPRFRGSQDQALDWLTEAHYLTALAQGDPSPDRSEIRSSLARFAAKSRDLAFRYSVVEDFTHLEWDRMRIFDLRRRDGGAGLGERMRFFEEVVTDAFARLYADEGSPPEHLIHVTCTGYLSPSPAQRLVSAKGWTETTVTHAYHMGCYASIPAVRLARDPARRTDIVHTELCTLHFDPRLKNPEHLVIQGLFADGLIRYGAYEDRAFAEHGPSSGLRLLSLREELIPGTESEMTWMPGDSAMLMTLSKDVAAHIAERLPSYLERLAGPAASRDLLREALFAIHPGGPKVIAGVRRMLGLRREQTHHSEDVFRRHGNMSSATLPFVWKEILDDPRGASGRKVVSMAFGPGLTIAGAVFEGVGSS